VIAYAFSGADFFFGLLVGHSGIDTFEDLAFRQTSVLEARHFSAGHNRLAIQMTMENELNRGIRKADELESDGVDADGVELVGASDIEDLRLGESSAGQIGSGFGADEDMLVDVRGADQFDATVIAKARVLQFNNLSDFLVGNIEPLELLDVAGEHPGLVQRTIIREGMLMAACRREDAHSEKQSLVPHNYIVGAGKREMRMCAWLIPGWKYRSQKR